jgi:hypothetical protein
VTPAAVSGARHTVGHLNRWGVYICADCRNDEHHGGGHSHASCQCTCTGYYDSRGRYTGRPQ